MEKYHYKDVNVIMDMCKCHYGHVYKALISIFSETIILFCSQPTGPVMGPGDCSAPLHCDSVLSHLFCS